jgi:hypothetical protein
MMKVYLVLALFCLCALSEEIAEEREQATREVRLWSKVGLGWPKYVGSGENPNNMWALAGNGWNKISWVYTWNARSFTAAQQAGLEFVPMFWGQKVLGEFTSARDESNSFAGATAILGFNEPDHPGEANLSPDAAVSLWKTYIQPLKAKGLRLGAPAVTSDLAVGKPWLQSFISKCTGCTIDFIPLHWYGYDGPSFVSYVQTMRNTFNKPIWITEWACSPLGGDPNRCTQQKVHDLMGYTTQWLDNTAYVERFAYVILSPFPSLSPFLNFNVSGSAP